MTPEPTARDLARWLLASGDAHATFDAAVAGLDAGSAGARAQGHPHTAWQLVEHLRLAQRDILDFSRSETFDELDWPEDYWPATDAPPDEAAWTASLTAFRADLGEMQALLADPARDPLAQLPWAKPGVSLLREALLLADHNAYHVGQIVALRRALGSWPPRG